jgi:U3 small nucleolar RNA-associated protein 23
MASATEDVRERDERKKLRSMLKDKTPANQSLKRKRDEDAPTQTGDTPAPAGISLESGQSEGEEARPKKKKKHHRGPKGPNPLSVKKPKRRQGTTAPKGKK